MSQCGCCPSRTPARSKKTIGTIEDHPENKGLARLRPNSFMARIGELELHRTALFTGRGLLTLKARGHGLKNRVIPHSQMSKNLRRSAVHLSNYHAWMGLQRILLISFAAPPFNVKVSSWTLYTDPQSSGPRLQIRRKLKNPLSASRNLI